VETNESAIPVEINERNQLAIPSANTTKPSIFTLETNEPLVEDVHTSNTLVSPSLPLRSIPGTEFGQFHAFQYTNGSLQQTSGSITPTFTEFGRFQALQRTGVG
jgi:hypothetical protein